MRLKAIKKTNAAVLTLYVALLAVLVIWNWLIEGSAIVPLVVLAYYALTGFWFGFLELGVVVWLYIKERRNWCLLLLFMSGFYAFGSLSIMIFSDLAL
jgi:hypothetical protein